MNVELVRVVTADGVRLEGTLRRAESPESGPLPVDVMIFHHGIGGNFYNQTFFEPMADAFLERGCAVLRVNNRGRDLAYNSPAAQTPVQKLYMALKAVDDGRSLSVRKSGERSTSRKVFSPEISGKQADTGLVFPAIYLLFAGM